MCHHEIVCVHFHYDYSMDEYNVKKYAPTCLDHVWVTK